MISSEIVWLEPQFCRQYCLPGQPITARLVWWPQFCPENGLSGRVWYCFQLCCRVTLVPNIRVLDRFKAKDLKIGSYYKYYQITVLQLYGISVHSIGIIILNYLYYYRSLVYSISVIVSVLLSYIIFIIIVFIVSVLLYNIILIIVLYYNITV